MAAASFSSGHSSIAAETLSIAFFNMSSGKSCGGGCVHNEMGVGRSKTISIVHLPLLSSIQAPIQIQTATLSPIPILPLGFPLTVPSCCPYPSFDLFHSRLSSITLFSRTPNTRFSLLPSYACIFFVTYLLNHEIRVRIRLGARVNVRVLGFRVRVQ